MLKNIVFVILSLCFFMPALADEPTQMTKEQAYAEVQENISTKIVTIKENSDYALLTILSNQTAGLQKTEKNMTGVSEVFDTARNVADSLVKSAYLESSPRYIEIQAIKQLRTNWAVDAEIIRTAEMGQLISSAQQDQASVYANTISEWCEEAKEQGREDLCRKPVKKVIKMLRAFSKEKP